MNCDVIVLGGGVAGCATALALQRQGMTTVNLERTAKETTRVGEHLTPDARPLLSQLGLWESFCSDEHLPSPGVRASWGDASIYEREYIVNPYGNGWNLDRIRFDTLLATAVIATGGTIFHNAQINTISLHEKVWSVEAFVAGQRRFFSSAFIVNATGRSAHLARKFGATQVAFDRLMGVMGWMKAGAGANITDATLLIEAVAEGWWYATLMPDKRLLVAFMTDPPLFSRRAENLNSLWLTRMEQTLYIRTRAVGFSLDNVVVRRANSCFCNPIAGNRWLSVGDAAIAFDPLSSMGITKALRSGLVAADVIRRYLIGDNEALREYVSILTIEFRRYVAAYNFYYGQEMRWADRSFWCRRHTGLSVS
ncbi:MAG: FAD-binding protein [Nitrosomonas sp.]|uniref:FAD-dependent monooxygenase n=1 Tax=Nitrosomonas sp. TaxID=42353 RepID=UPI0032EAA3CE